MALTIAYSARRSMKGGRSRNANGFLIADVVLSAPGVQEFFFPKGLKALITPEALASGATIESAKHIPVTLGHPKVGELVYASNAKEYQVGYVTDDVKIDEQGNLVSRIVVTAEDAIKAVENGIEEVSIGFSCKLDASPGTLNGQDYQKIARNPLAINHLAIVQEGAAGPKVRIQAQGASVMPEEPTPSPTPASPLSKATPAPELASMVKEETMRFLKTAKEKEEIQAAAEAKRSKDLQTAVKTRARAIFFAQAMISDPKEHQKLLEMDTDREIIMAGLGASNPSYKPGDDVPDAALLEVLQETALRRGAAKEAKTRHENAPSANTEVQAAGGKKPANPLQGVSFQRKWKWTQRNKNQKGA